MSQKSRTVLKSYFELGDKPTEQQFVDLIDSLDHYNDLIEMNRINGLQDALDELALQADLDAHVNNDVIHVNQADNDNWNGKANAEDVYTKEETKGHIHTAQMVVSPTGAAAEANSFRLRQNGNETILESTADGAVWDVLQIWSIEE